MAHETVAELTTEIIGRVQDPSFTSARILRYLNQGMKEISGHPMVFLPQLTTSTTVDTDTSNPYTDLPSNYQKRLHYCHSTTNNRQIRIYNSYAHLLQYVSDQDQNGRVWGVAVRGSYLYYQRIPSTAETLQIHYYKTPTTLSASVDPTEIPEHLCRYLLVNFVCAEIFKLKSVSDAQYVAALKTYEAYYNNALSSLISFLGPEECIPYELDDGIDYDSYL